MGNKNQTVELNTISKNTGYWVSEVFTTVSDKKSGSGVDFFISLQKEIADKYNVSYQVFKPHQIISHDHLKMVLQHVETAFLKGYNISKTPSFEFLLYLARVRQIKRAITRVGADLDHPMGTSLNFSEILFGMPADVKNAKIHLLEQTKSYKRAKLNFVPLNNIAVYLKTNDISELQLKNFIQTADINEIPERKGYQYLLKLPETIVREAVVDCLAGYMLTLFLENYRKTKGGSN